MKIVLASCLAGGVLVNLLSYFVPALDVMGHALNVIATVGGVR